VPRMLEIRALREVESWTGPSVIAAVILGLALGAFVTWLIYRYLRD
jgi:high-affinity Fe2+/Pb2+ permease